YFFEKQYDKAILEYEKVTKKFPSSNKVPYALLKQGISFQNLGDKISAKLLLQQVIKDYPNTSQARIARSKLAETK
ncbi:MAG: tetratricopeptide repeat protein, partial [Smithellaceae bacterium]